MLHSLLACIVFHEKSAAFPVSVPLNLVHLFFPPLAAFYDLFLLFFLIKHLDYDGPRCIFRIFLVFGVHL